MLGFAVCIHVLNARETCDQKHLLGVCVFTQVCVSHDLVFPNWLLNQSWLCEGLATDTVLPSLDSVPYFSVTAIFTLRIAFGSVFSWNSAPLHLPRFLLFPGLFDLPVE